jgi:hypothetical protein
MMLSLLILLRRPLIFAKLLVKFNLYLWHLYLIHGTIMLTTGILQHLWGIHLFGWRQKLWRSTAFQSMILHNRLRWLQPNSKWRCGTNICIYGLQNMIPWLNFEKKIIIYITFIHSSYFVENVITTEYSVVIQHGYSHLHILPHNSLLHTEMKMPLDKT